MLLPVYANPVRAVFLFRKFSQIVNFFVRFFVKPNPSRSFESRINGKLLRQN
ncbi:MAG: hypothetical protein AVDCRST_MAG95-2888 [uncultured Adhaeribacter sp.]|uniref:Uncharacterized protein n=1 Tax=uncultured Adhaeribacter sp. TaxID=448109 RepID=A0A6J4JDL5_9BACT|nr:MAG: hypothetical protein AVDCRST_MAG95-2888 [uncultured Adhaeribacter sp.]